LIVDCLVDLDSTDQHTVRPWFNGKIDYAPPVVDFATSRFEVIGGRKDYVAGRPAAALVRRRQAHLGDLFIWPNRSGAGHGDVDVRRLLVGTLNDAHLSYWAVSDFDLSGLADLVPQSRPPTAPRQGIKPSLRESSLAKGAVS
jgi:anti-sigma factor RsiW